jgi:hypothetical protein
LVAVKVQSAGFDAETVQPDTAPGECGDNGGDLAC